MPERFYLRRIVKRTVEYQIIKAPTRRVAARFGLQDHREIEERGTSWMLHHVRVHVIACASSTIELWRLLDAFKRKARH